jgi:hypothetical protein
VRRLEIATGQHKTVDVEDTDWRLLRNDRIPVNLARKGRRPLLQICMM